MAAEEVLIGEIVMADFEDPEYPGAATVTVRLDSQARVGHWWVRMERIEKPTPGVTSLKVTWADAALSDALAGLISYRDDPQTGPPRLNHIMAAIDALRACLADG